MESAGSGKARSFSMFSLQRAMALLMCLSVSLALALSLSACSSDKSAVGESPRDGAVAQEDSSSDSDEKAQDSAPAIDPSCLKQNTEYLEYSDKSTDPLGLVTCDDDEVVVTSPTSEVALDAVGELSVVYRLEREGADAADVAVSFVVRDTKPPKIELVADELEIDQGEALDIRSNIASVADPVDGSLAYVDSEPDKISDTGRQYDQGWYTVATNLDTGVAGAFYVKVTACDIHGNRVEKEYKIVVNEVTQPEPAVPAEEPTRNTQRYILNTNTHKFHNPSCSSVNQMSEKNKWDTDEYTREEIIEMGYDPCKRCSP